MGRSRWSWGRRAFRFTRWACAQFVVLTALAMVVFPGGSRADPTSRRYSFFHNFFSELGLTVTRSGAPNTVCLILFVTALTLAGLGLVVFFVFAPRFFWRAPLPRLLSLAGSLFGVASGLSYIGIAWNPADVSPSWHGKFTLWAFQAFLVTAGLYALATLMMQGYPKVYAVVYIAFAALLAGYVWLMLHGPGMDTPRGVMIQATGQKLIVYAAVVCVFIQSWGAERLLSGESAARTA
jgi:hypothetical protein